MSDARFSDTVAYIVKALVDNPGQVEVREIDEDASLLLEVHVASGDMGRVIGRGGRVINAIRTVAQAMASDDDMRIQVELAE